jgi:hypothetical protein
MAWLVLTVPTLNGPIRVEVKLKRDVVEWWLGRRSIAMIDRDALKEWLERPRGVFSKHDVSLVEADQGVAIAIRGLLPPTLPMPPGLADLRRRLLDVP